jgi:putative DNA modification/repair radical SAM protein
MELQNKIALLAEAAKYDVSCSSSGSHRAAEKGKLGHASPPGICHSWAEDGRCISLLKILMSNDCIYDCAYCVNKSSNGVERVTFTAEELVKLTIGFYRRNYIEGLFISSAVVKSPDFTMEQMIEVVRLLREREGYNGYIHMKGIPGADLKLIEKAGLYVDRMSLNLELPTAKSLLLLAPQKNQNEILLPMDYLKGRIIEAKASRIKSSFVPAGQTTQMMVGASDDSDYDIMSLAESMYEQRLMKRVYYSAYVPVFQNVKNLPSTLTSPLHREHRLYQADWLLRFYGFNANELLNPNRPNLDITIDPKAFWAISNLDLFPVDINRASLDTLLRVPGIGPISARRIVATRRFGPLTYEGLKKTGVVLKRAKYFITLSGKYYATSNFEPDSIRKQLILTDSMIGGQSMNQLTLLDAYAHTMPELLKV